jgi:hypothetical protein
MMITTTLGAILAARSALTSLGQQPLHAVAAFQVGRLLTVLKDEGQEGEQAFNALIVKYGALRVATSEERSRGLSGEVYQVTPENVDAFGQERDALWATPVTIARPPLDLASPGFTTLVLSATDLLTLMAAGLVLDSTDVTPS